MALVVKDGDGNLTSLKSTLSGSDHVTHHHIDSLPALVAGTAAIGKLAANSGVDIGDVDVTSIIPGTGATNLGKAIDSVVGGTDTGIAALAKRVNSPAGLTPANGDYVNLQVDQFGYLYVLDTNSAAIVTNTGSVDNRLASAIVSDDGAFTPGTGQVIPAGMFADEVTPDSVNEGDIGVPRMSLNRIQYHIIRDGNGNERGAFVDAAGNLQVLPAATEVHLGQVSGHSDVVSITPTVSASPDYSIGDAVGGIQTITSAARVSGGKSLLQSIFMVDKANVKPQFTILFFDSNPAAATVTDNSAFVFSTDIAKCIGKIKVTTGDWDTYNSIALADIAVPGRIKKASGSANLYAVIVADAAINLATTSDLRFDYGFLQD